MKPVYPPTPVGFTKSKKKPVKKKPAKKKAKREMTVVLRSIWNNITLHYVKAASRKEAILHAMQEEYCESESACKIRYQERGWSAFVFPGHIGETI